MEVSQRWLNFLRDEEVDRLPVFPTAMGHCAKVMGAPNLGDFYSKPDFCIKSQIISREMYGWDQPPILIDPGYFTDIWGGKSILPYNPKMGSPMPVQPGALTPEDLENKEIPNPKTAKWMPEYWEMIRIAIENNQMPYVCIFGGWITHTAPMLAPLEDFMIWMIEQPDLVHLALSKTAEFGHNLVEALVDEFGSDSFYIFEPNPTDSNTLLDSNMFKEYPMKHVIDMNNKILDKGVSIWLHWCADHNQNIDAGHVEAIPVGPEGFINFGPETTMEKQVDKLSYKFRLVGNINPPLIMTAEYDEWQDICLKNIEEGKDAKKGYSLGMGCELPPPSPPSNTYGMVKVAEKYGKI